MITAKIRHRGSPLCGDWRVYVMARAAIRCLQLSNLFGSLLLYISTKPYLDNLALIYTNLSNQTNLSELAIIYVD